MNKKSFTLIELLVVIAIIGILSSLVVARFSDWGDNARIANTLQWSSGVHRTLGANLVGHWPLNGDAKDISGYGNDGTITGSPEWVSGVPGTGNQSPYFDDTSEYIEIAHNEDISFSRGDEFTISVWIKVDSHSGSYGIIHKGIGTGSYGISLNSVGIRIGFRDSASNYRALTRSVKYGDWSHIVMTAKDPSTNVYIEGSLSGSIDYPTPEEFSDTLSYGIGHPSRFLEGTTGVMEGSISDVRIYNTVLTAEEVGRIYAETKGKYLVEGK